VNAVERRPASAVEPIDLARLDLDSFAGRPVAVLGLARTGIALARFLADRGAHVTVYDGRPKDALTAAIDALGGRDVELMLGPEADPEAVLAGRALVASSPSINARYPTTEPRLRAALERLERSGRTPILSEVDLFLRLCPSPTVGITGTKGKTTTSALTAAVLGAGEAPVVLGGNIGTPLVERLPELTPRHRVVVELSELQLPTLSRGTDVAVYTHVTQDHLDRHGTVEAYRAAKRRLAELVPPDGRIVVNDEDPVSAAFATVAPARAVRYRRMPPLAGGVGVADGAIVADGVVPLPVADGGSLVRDRILATADIPLLGWHNVSNVLAAVAVGLLFGIDPPRIEGAVRSFRGVEHRLEPAGELDGIRFINDSQGTQPDAVIAALRAFPPDLPLALIAGGQDKGADYAELAAVATERATVVLLIGENAPRIAAALDAAGHAAVERHPSLGAAVRRAHELVRGAVARDGRPGGIVLLSPAAASFDMFTDYAARGDAFKATVAELMGDRGRAARGGEGR
jgi:UDP-N-acetylmuramoylalanine--D-glutamate ligase